MKQVLGAYWSTNFVRSDYSITIGVHSNHISVNYNIPVLPLSCNCCPRQADFESAPINYVINIQAQILFDSNDT